MVLLNLGPDSYFIEISCIYAKRSLWAREFSRDKQTWFWLNCGVFVGLVLPDDKSIFVDKVFPLKLNLLVSCYSNYRCFKLLTRLPPKELFRESWVSLAFVVELTKVLVDNCYENTNFSLRFMEVGLWASRPSIFSSSSQWQTFPIP